MLQPLSHHMKGTILAEESGPWTKKRRRKKKRPTLSLKPSLDPDYIPWHSVFLLHRKTGGHPLPCQRADHAADTHRSSHLSDPNNTTENKETRVSRDGDIQEFFFLGGGGRRGMLLQG